MADERTAYVPLEEKRPHGSVVAATVKEILIASETKPVRVVAQAEVLKTPVVEKPPVSPNVPRKPGRSRTGSASGSRFEGFR